MRFGDLWGLSRYYVRASLTRQIDSVIRLWLSGKKGLTLVDFGCGRMPYRSLFERYVNEYIGVDLLGNELASYYSSRHCTTDLANDVADLVLSTQVLEHVENPVAYLHECHRILNAGGLLILTTHGYWKYHPDPCDLWRWTGDGLRKLLEDASFRIVSFQGIINLAAVSVQLFQDALLGAVPSFLRPVFVLLTQCLIALFDRMPMTTDKTQEACIFVVVARPNVA